MPRLATRFVIPLTDEDKEVLRYLKNEGENARIRSRAHAILLSDAGHSINDIAGIFDTDRDTVCSWISRWEAEGPIGLADKPRSGAPRALTDSECDKVLEFLKEHPHSPKQVLRRIQKELGKTISNDTLRRIARRAGLKWKRMRRSLKTQRNEEDFRDAQEDLANMIESHCSGELDLYYFDEAGFSLTPNVPYGWQPVGETIEIPSRRSKQVNILGFLSYSGQCRPYAVDGKVNSGIVVDCFDEFCTTLKRDTIVAIDNASVHSSTVFTSNIPRWREKGLFVYFLPAYCPELNLIEILWRMIKYHWLPLKAYDDFKSLIRNLADVFSRVGKDLSLDFNAPSLSTQ
jgi:transposase